MMYCTVKQTYLKIQKRNDSIGKMRGIQKARKPAATKAKGQKGQPTLEEFIGPRDYTGALALLEFKLKCKDGNIKDLLMWIGYTAFHLGNYRRAEDAYKELIEDHDPPPEVHLFLSCCYYFQQMYDEAEIESMKGPNSPLKNRLLFNVAHRKGDEDKLMAFHQNLRDKKDDQLCLAAMHYLRNHHQEVRNTNSNIDQFECKLSRQSYNRLQTFINASSLKIEMIWR
jgi:intraflagellar transport protein 56